MNKCMNLKEIISSQGKSCDIKQQYKVPICQNLCNDMALRYHIM